MLRELTGPDWQRLLEVPADRVPRVGILRGTRNLKHYCDLYADKLADVHPLGSPNGLIDDLILGRIGEVDVAYASVYGPAMASELAHVFSLLGVGLILQTGCCGGWGEGIRAGDLFVARTAGCGDGASHYYTPGRERVSAGYDILPVVARDVPEELSVHSGGLYTTAALFAESKKEIRAWDRKGWAAVDMETATTFAVAEHFQVPAASLLFVFDNPLTEGDLVLSDEDKNQRRSLGNAAMIDATFRVVESFAAGDRTA